MCGPLLFELKERSRGYQGQTSTLGSGRRQGYQVVQSLWLAWRLKVGRIVYLVVRVP